eukprot:g2973.t1
MAGRNKAKFNWKDTEKANAIFSEVGGTLGGLERKNNLLKQEIRDDQDGVAGFDRILGQLYKKRDFLQKRMDENVMYAKQFDEKIGPFEKMYEGLTKDIDVLYRNAKKQHAQGIEVLKQEFDYHPLFKRKNGEFTGVPFKPK